MTNKDPSTGDTVKTPGHRSGDSKERLEWISKQLRRVYDDVVREDVPDRFSDLLKQLEEKEKGGR